MTKKIKRIHPQTGEEIIFNSLKEAIEQTVSINNRSFGTHVDKANVSLCINGKLNFAAGYKWEKIDQSISLDGETWKEYPGNPKVLVSTFGRVKEGDDLRKPIIDKNGGNLKIFINNKITLLWKVVAITYSTITPTTKCFFKDRNKENCSVENLSLISPLQGNKICLVCNEEKTVSEFHGNKCKICIKNKTK